MNLADTLPPLEVAQIGAQIAAALTEAHAAGIVHRDIKPGNILIADRGKSLGTVKISDFGIARAKSDVSDTQDEVITGTPAYFAPEVARGDDPTEASDVFSLGSTLYTVIEGQPPFGIDSDAIALLHRVAKAEIYRPTKSGPLTDVLLQLLEPDPTRRPTMAQARDALAAAATGGWHDRAVDRRSRLLVRRRRAGVGSPHHTTRRPTPPQSPDRLHDHRTACSATEHATAERSQPHGHVLLAAADTDRPRRCQHPRQGSGLGSPRHDRHGCRHHLGRTDRRHPGVHGLTGRSTRAECLR